MFIDHYSLFLAALYFIIFGWFSLTWLIEPKVHSDKEADSPFVSVIVPFENYSENLNTLIASLSEQNYPESSYELILVDDYSGTELPEHLFQGKGARIRRVRNAYKKGKKYALKTGIEHARSEIILQTDADCNPGPGWIRSVCGAIPAGKEFLISSPVFIEKGKGWWHNFQALEFSSLVATGAVSFLAGSPIMCNGANLSFSKTLYLRAFNNTYPDVPTGDDMFLMLFAKKEKKAILSFLKNPDAVVETSSKPSVGSFFHQRKRWSSKAVLYRDPHLIIISILVLFINLGILHSLVSFLLSGRSIIPFIVLAVVKMTTDLVFLAGFLKTFGRSGLLKFFLPSQLIYPFYILVSALAGIIEGLPYLNKYGRK